MGRRQRREDLRHRQRLADDAGRGDIDLVRIAADDAALPPPPSPRPPSCPARPVKTLALPELTTMARAVPRGRQRRHQSTGAPGVSERVNTPATAVPGSSDRQHQIAAVAIANAAALRAEPHPGDRRQIGKSLRRERRDRGGHPSRPGAYLPSPSVPGASVGGPPMDGGPPARRRSPVGMSWRRSAPGRPDAAPAAARRRRGRLRRAAAVGVEDLDLGRRGQLLHSRGIDFLGHLPGELRRDLLVGRRPCPGADPRP